MKKSTFKFLPISIFVLLFGYQSAFSQVSGCDSLNTLYNYSYLNHGVMFNVTAQTSLTLDHLTANLNDGTAKYKIYYKTGSFFGYETQPSAWTLIDSAIVLSNNTLTLNNQPTVIPINLNLSMVQNDTIALYLVSMPLSMVYLTSTTVGWGNNYSSDNYIAISIARSVYQLFGVPFSTPQNFNGSVSYCTTTTSVSELSSSSKIEEIVLYRNADDLIVNLPSNILDNNNECNLELYDLLGQRVMSTKITSESNIFDISTLKNEVYICLVKKGNQTLKKVKIY